MVKKTSSRFVRLATWFFGSFCFFILSYMQVCAETAPGFEEFYEYDMQDGREKEYMEKISGKKEETAMIRTSEASSLGNFRSRWVKKNGGWYYYDRNGKILKSGIYKIKGYYYQFDKKGRRTSAKNVDTRGFTTLFDAKTGKMVSRSILLKVVKINGNDKNGYTLKARSYKAPGSFRKTIYTISVGKKKVNTALTDTDGRKVKVSRIRKNAVLRVYTSSFYILEIDPPVIPDITRIVVLKNGKK